MGHMYLVSVGGCAWEIRENPVSPMTISFFLVNLGDGVSLRACESDFTATDVATLESSLEGGTTLGRMKSQKVYDALAAVEIPLTAIEMLPVAVDLSRPLRYYLWLGPVCARLSPPPTLALSLSLHRPPYFYITPSSRFIRYFKCKKSQVRSMLASPSASMDILTCVNLGGCASFYTPTDVATVELSSGRWDRSFVFANFKTWGGNLVEAAGIYLLKALLKIARSFEHSSPTDV